MRQLTSNQQLLLASAAVAAGTTVVNGALIDRAGYEDASIIVSLGAITATGVPTLKVQQGEAADGSDVADLEGASVVGDDADGTKFLVIDIHRPKGRYLKPVLNRATANVAVNGIFVILSNPLNAPVDQPQVAASVALNSPDYA